MTSEIEAPVVTLEQVLDMIEQAQSLRELAGVMIVASQLSNGSDKDIARHAHILKFASLRSKRLQQQEK